MISFCMVSLMLQQNLCSRNRVDVWMRNAVVAGILKHAIYCAMTLQKYGWYGFRYTSAGVLMSSVEPTQRVEQTLRSSVTDSELSRDCKS